MGGSEPDAARLLRHHRGRSGRLHLHRRERLDGRAPVQPRGGFVEPGGGHGEDARAVRGYGVRWEDLRDGRGKPAELADQRS